MKAVLCHGGLSHKKSTAVTILFCLCFFFTHLFVWQRLCVVPQPSTSTLPGPSWNLTLMWQRRTATRLQREPSPERSGTCQPVYSPVSLRIINENETILNSFTFYGCFFFFFYFYFYLSLERSIVLFQPSND